MIIYAFKYKFDESPSIFKKPSPTCIVLENSQVVLLTKSIPRGRAILYSVYELVQSKQNQQINQRRNSAGIVL